MDKNREKCVLDELKTGLLQFIIELTEDEIKEDMKAHPVPEKKSPLAKYETEEVIDEKCVTADGQSSYIETFMPVVSGGRKLPVIVNIHGGGFVREDRSFRRQYNR